MVTSTKEMRWMMKNGIIVGLLFGLSNFGVCTAGDILSPQGLGVDFRVSAEELFVGDTLSLCVDIWNPSQETYENVPLFVCWSPDSYWQSIYYFPFDAQGQWEPFDVHYYIIDVPPGVTEMEIIPPVVVPETAGEEFIATTHFVAGMSDPSFTEIFGSVDWLDVLFHW